MTPLQVFFLMLINGIILLCSFAIVVNGEIMKPAATLASDGNIITVTTNCSDQRQVLQAPSVEDVGELVVSFNGSGSNVTPLTCSWLLNPLHPNSSNVFDFSSYNYSLCHDIVLIVYDLDPASNNLTFVANACSLESSQFMGQAGYGSLISLSIEPSTRILEDQLSLFYYSSFLWTKAMCQIEAPLKATYENATFRFPENLARAPNNLACSWAVQTPAKGVLWISLSNFNYHAGDATDQCNSGDYIFILDASTPQTESLINVTLCSDGISFQHESVGGYMIMGFVSDSSGGASEFVLTYHAEDMGYLCPTTSHELRATPHHVEVFKGVNHAEGDVAERDCFWRITAPNSMVVKLVKIYNTDYLYDCAKQDYLIFENETKIDMCGNSAFPLWSRDSSIIIHFHAEAGSERRQFYIFYTAVPRGECQGRPMYLQAEVEPHNIFASSLSANGGDTENGSNCQWLLTSAHEDDTIAVQLSFTRDNTSADCLRNVLFAYDGPGASPDARLLPDSENSTCVYTSRSQSMLIVFNRDPAMTTRDISMSYVEVFKSVPDSNVSGATAAVVHFCAVSVLNLITIVTIKLIA